MSRAKDKKDRTHFGYKTVSTDEKTESVQDVFNSVSKNYDLMNDLMSFGLHRIWKRIAIDYCWLKPGHQVLDLACGTCDLSQHIISKIGSGSIVAADLNLSMLEVGRNRMLDKGITKSISYVQLNAEELPFSDELFNLVIIGFGLRNFTDKQKALHEIYRVLKPGGQIVILEFSKPKNDLIKCLYDKYSFNILPKLGGLIAGDAESYKYLVESIRMHPDQAGLTTMLKDAMFTCCNVTNLLSGVVALHRGIKC